jgi:hypothetical protein
MFVDLRSVRNDLTRLGGACVLALSAGGSAVIAQGAQGPPLRPLGPVVASSPTRFLGVGEVRALSDGRVLVNDSRARMVLMLDSTLRGTAKVVLDSAAGSSNSYSVRYPGLLLAGLGDTSLFVDPRAGAILTIRPDGALGTATALPPVPKDLAGNEGANAASWLAQAGGKPAVSTTLGLVYRHPLYARGAPKVRIPNPNDTTVFVVDDSATILAMHPATRSIDTLAGFATGLVKRYAFLPGLRQTPANITQLPRLLTTGDSWAVMADGSIGILHGREYRMSWIDAGGTRTESRPILYPWKRLSDADKQRIVDSANAEAQQKYDVEMAEGRTDSAAGRPYGPFRGMPASPFRPPRAVTANPLPHYDVNDMPDYVSPFVPGTRAFMADADNRVWIRVTRGGDRSTAETYDVVDRQGVLIDRVRLPEARQLIGFGPHEAVYLLGEDGGKQLLERARFK